MFNFNGDIINPMDSVLDSSVDFKKMNLTHSTMNLFDTTKMRLNYNNSYWIMENGYYEPVESGKYLVSNISKIQYFFYDDEKKEISKPSITNSPNEVLVPDGTTCFRVQLNAAQTSEATIKSKMICYSGDLEHPKEGFPSKYIPYKKWDSSVLDDTLYDETIPQDSRSDFMNRIRYEVARDRRFDDDIIRIGTFNCYLPRTSTHWSIIKKELQDYLVDICLFQEVYEGTTTDKRYLSEYLKSWQFPYGSSQDVSSNKAVSSHWEIISTEVLEFDPPASLSNGTVVKCVIKLYPYKFYRNEVRECTLSVYSYHGASVNASYEGVTYGHEQLRMMQTQQLIDKFLAVDTSDFIVVGGDTNSWHGEIHDDWKLLNDAGFKQVHRSTSATNGTGKGNVRFGSDGIIYTSEGYDQIFVSDNIEVVRYNVVPSTDYPTSSASYLSDHSLVYADLKFDFESVMQKKLAQYALPYETIDE